MFCIMTNTEVLCKEVLWKEYRHVGYSNDCLIDGSSVTRGTVSTLEISLYFCLFNFYIFLVLLRFKKLSLDTHIFCNVIKDIKEVYYQTHSFSKCSFLILILVDSKVLSLSVLINKTYGTLSIYWFQVSIWLYWQSQIRSSNVENENLNKINQIN